MFLAPHKKKIRFWLSRSLIFFLCVSCNDHKKSTALSIQWENGRATGIVIPSTFLAAISAESLKQTLRVDLKTSPTAQGILGEYKNTGDEIIFRPLIPLTRGLTYTVRLRDQVVSEIKVPEADPSSAPMVLAVYPTKDSLPDNLLKIYIKFSKPMKEGEALQHILLLKNESDTIPSAFLDLQPELWNNEQTMLTIWLDPGRIKRDLQPNKMMGAPLEPGAHYQLIIDKNWRDTEGSPLAQGFDKRFHIISRDSISPDPSNWKLNSPTKNTKKSLFVDFPESLDYGVLNNVFRVLDEKKAVVMGSIWIKPAETGIVFTPSTEWKTGKYTLEIESRLEDLAGNNLNRLFDNDLTKNKKKSQDVFVREFRVE